LVLCEDRTRFRERDGGEVMPSPRVEEYRSDRSVLGEQHRIVRRPLEAREARGWAWNAPEPLPRAQAPQCDLATTGNQQSLSIVAELEITDVLVECRLELGGAADGVHVCSGAVDPGHPASIVGEGLPVCGFADPFVVSPDGVWRADGPEGEAFPAGSEEAPSSGRGHDAEALLALDPPGDQAVLRVENGDAVVVASHDPPSVWREGELAALSEGTREEGSSGCVVQLPSGGGHQAAQKNKDALPVPRRLEEHAGTAVEDPQWNRSADLPGAEIRCPSQSSGEYPLPVLGERQPRLARREAEGGED